MSIFLIFGVESFAVNGKGPGRLLFLKMLCSDCSAGQVLAPLCPAVKTNKRSLGIILGPSICYVPVIYNPPMPFCIVCCCLHTELRQKELTQ